MPTEPKPVQPHEQRVLDEYEQLRDRREKLAAFFDSEVFARLDKAEQDRLDSQYHIMGAYKAVLIQRIEAMGHGERITTPARVVTEFYPDSGGGW